MPFKSRAQQRYMWANHPTMAREFQDATPAGAKLPGRVAGGKPGDAASKSATQAGWDPSMSMFAPVTLPGGNTLSPNAQPPPAPPIGAPGAQPPPAQGAPTAAMSPGGARPVPAQAAPAPGDVASLKLAGAMRRYEGAYSGASAYGKAAFVPSGMPPGAPQLPPGAPQAAQPMPPGGGAPTPGGGAPAPQQGPTQPGTDTAQGQLAAMQHQPMPPPATQPTGDDAARGRTPGFTNPMPGAPNPLGAGTLAYGGMRAPGISKVAMLKGAIDAMSAASISSPSPVPDVPADAPSYDPAYSLACQSSGGGTSPQGKPASRAMAAPSSNGSATPLSPVPAYPARYGSDKAASEVIANLRAKEAAGGIGGVIGGIGKAVQRTMGVGRGALEAELGRESGHISSFRSAPRPVPSSLAGSSPSWTTAAGAPASRPSMSWPGASPVDSSTMTSTVGAMPAAPRPRFQGVRNAGSAMASGVREGVQPGNLGRNLAAGAVAGAAGMGVRNAMGGGQPAQPPTSVAPIATPATAQPPTSVAPIATPPSAHSGVMETLKGPVGMAGAGLLGAYGVSRLLAPAPRRRDDDVEKAAGEEETASYLGELLGRVARGMRTRPPHLHRQDSMSRPPRTPRLPRRESLSRLPRSPRASWKGLKDEAESLDKYAAVIADLREKAAGGFGASLAAMGRRATSRGALGQTIAGGLGGAAVGAGELASGVADPNMSSEAKGSLVGLNALGGAVAGNPMARRALFTRRTLTPMNTGGLAPRIVRGVGAKPMAIAGAAATAASLPKTVNLTDATARLGRSVQDSWTNNPDALKPIVDPAGFAHDVATRQTDNVMNSPTTQAATQVFGSTLGKGLAGMAGGGVTGGIVGRGLGGMLAPDDEKLDYDARRRRERVRGGLLAGGAALGGVGGTLAMQKYGMEKAAMDDDYAWCFMPLEGRIADLREDPRDWPMKAKQVDDIRRQVDARDKRAYKDHLDPHAPGTGITTDQLVDRLNAPAAAKSEGGMLTTAYLDQLGKATKRRSPSRGVYNGREMRVQHGPTTHANGQFSSMGRHKKADDPSPAVSRGVDHAMDGLGPLLSHPFHLSTLAGGALGGVMAPKGYAPQGVVRGSIAGLGTSLGAGLGGAAGLYATGNMSPEAGLAGGLAGLGLGALGGHVLANKAMGRPEWERDAEKAADYKERDHSVPRMGRGVPPPVVQPQATGAGYNRLSRKAPGASGYFGVSNGAAELGGHVPAPQQAPAARDPIAGLRGAKPMS